MLRDFFCYQSRVSSSRRHRHLLVGGNRLQSAALLRALDHLADVDRVELVARGRRQQNGAPREHRLHHRLQDGAVLHRQVSAAVLRSRLLQHSPCPDG